MKLPIDVYYRVLNISESYYILRNRLKEMGNSVLNGTARKDGQPHGSQISKPTENQAEKLIEKQAECERKINAIERALKPLGPLYKDFIKLNLFERRKMEWIDLPMSFQEKKMSGYTF